MTVSCEVVEELALATSSCPVTDVIVVEISGGASRSALLLGFTPPVLVDTAVATDAADGDSYLQAVSNGSSQSTLESSVGVNRAVSDKAVGESSAILFFDELVIDNASAQSVVISPDPFAILVSGANATDTASVNVNISRVLVSEATAVSSVFTGPDELVISSAVAVSTVTPQREIDYTAASQLIAGSSIPFSGSEVSIELSSSGSTTSSLTSQSILNQMLLSSAIATSGVYYRDTDRVAWVMNTESSAASWYDNFDFESIAQSPQKVLAVGPDGIYELEGGTDSGENIGAEVVSGFSDFGIPQTKRVDNMYFGYTSDGRISVTAETYESGHSPYTYFLEERAADAPRNSRITPGKGLWGRYWRMTIRNIEGKDFEIHDASVDIAVSSRRV